MCGVVAMLTGGDTGQEIYEALTILQHRGQDAAGIVTSDGQRVYSRTGRGLVRDVFSTESLHDLKGSAGIGHVRYPTAGANTEAECQPFYVNSPFGIALAHNGNLINAMDFGIRTGVDLASIALKHLLTQFHRIDEIAIVG